MTSAEHSIDRRLNLTIEKGDNLKRIIRLKNFKKQTRFIEQSIHTLTNRNYAIDSELKFVESMIVADQAA